MFLIACITQETLLPTPEFIAVKFADTNVCQRKDIIYHRKLIIRIQDASLFSGG
jgi:hypothetical protein